MQQLYLDLLTITIGVLHHFISQIINFIAIEYFVICELLVIYEICCYVMLRMQVIKNSFKQHFMHRSIFSTIL